MKPTITKANAWGRQRWLWARDWLWNMPAAWRYGLALGITAAATGLRWTLVPWMGAVALYNIALASVAVTAALFGFGPGLVSVFGGIVGVELFVLGSLQAERGLESWVRLETTAVAGVLVCWILQAMRAAQLKAQHHEARLAAFASATFEGIVESEDGRIIDCNEQLAQMAGRTVGELKGTAVVDLVVPEDRERVLANIRANRPSVTENRLTRADGTWLTVEARGWPADSGRRRYTAVRDISERKAAETTLAADLAALRRMHALSLRAVESANIQPLLQETTDAAVTIAEAEKGTLQLVEGDTLRIAACCGHERPFLDHFSAAEKVASVCGEARRQGGRVLVPDVETSPLFAGTASLPVLRAAGVRAVLSTPFHTRSGRLLGILTTHWSKPHTPDEQKLWRLDLLARQAADLIEHKQAQDALQQGQARLRLAQVCAGAGIWDWDLATDKLEWSAELFHLFGLDASRDEASFATWESIMHPEDRGAARDRIVAAMRQHAPLSNEYRIVLPDGGVRWIHALGNTVYDPEGKPLRMSGIGLDITARKRGEQDLASQREELRVILDSCPALIFYKDRDNRFLRVNRAFAEVMGAPREQLEGKSLFDLYPRAQAEAYWRDDQEVIASGQAKIDIVEPMQTPSGERWYQTGKVPCRDTQGNITGVIGFALDITENRRAEAVLRESEARAKIDEAVRGERQRLLDVLNMLPAYVVLLTPDYHVAVANRFFEERFGKADGRRCFECLFHRTTPCENCQSYEVLKTGEPQCWEWAGPDGRDYDVRDFPFTDVDGSTLILEVGLDITERKRAEEAVGRANAYNRSLIEANLDPLVTIGPDGKITDVNAATESATGYDRTVLVGTDFSNYFTEPDKARAGYREAFRAGSVRDYPLELRHRDGRATSVLYNASVYRNEDGTVAGVFAAARDITDRKRAEQEQQVLREQLARISRITTAGQLAASLAHELNQPLGAIVCNIQAVQNYLARGGAEQPELREALKDIEADGKRAGAVIHQLRALYQKTRHTRAVVRLNDLLQQTLNLLHSEFVLRKVEVQLELDAALPAIQGNEVELQQLVLNLVTNAVEAMGTCKPGARKLHISTGSMGSGRVQVSVRDSGTGLRKEQLERLFEPFRTTKASGMGMGLVISRSIVEAHNGRLWAENNADRGATFHFSLPTSGETPA